jgi:O-antigen ligase
MDIGCQIPQPREAIMTTQTPRFRMRVSTLLLVVAIVALLTVVVMQQLQIERMRQSLARAEQAKLTSDRDFYRLRELLSPAVR